MSQEKQTITIDWTEFHSKCNALINKLPLDKITEFIPVLRGGLVPATILSYATQKPINGGIYPNEGYLWKLWSINLHDWRGSCIIDDVCDTGATFDRIRPYFPGAIFAAVYVKERGLPHCHYHALVHPVRDDVWLSFPYGE